MLIKNVKCSRPIVDIVLIIVLFGVAVFFCSQKDIFFGDEVLTYESANTCIQGANAFEINGGRGVWVSGQDFKNLWSNVDGKLHFDKIVSELYTDHVPLYFFLIHVISWICNGSCSMWVGLGLNIAIYVCVGLKLYKVFLKKSSYLVATFITLGVMLCPIMLGQLTLIRMYMMFVSVILGLMVTIREDTFECWSKSLLVGCLLSIGMLTHYYVWIYAGLLILEWFIFACVSRNWRSVARIVVASIFAGMITTIVYPKWTYRIFADNGKQAIKNVFSFVTIKMDLVNSLKSGGVLLVLALLLILFFVSKDHFYTKQVYFAFVATSLYIFLVAHTTPNNIIDRYVGPAKCVYLCLCAYMFIIIFQNQKKLIIAVSMVAMVISIVRSSNLENITYLTCRSVRDKNVIESLSETPWIVASDTFDWRMTCIQRDFMIPNNIMWISLDTPTREDEVLLNNDEIILYVMKGSDISPFVYWIETSKGMGSAKLEKISSAYQTDVFRLSF